MFDHIIEFLSGFGERLSPCEILMEYEGGVLMRFGRPVRDVGPGVVWKWPMIDKLLSCHTAVTTHRTDYQTLTTMDGKDVKVRAIVKYKIEKPRPYLLEIWDSTDVLNDVTMGAIKKVVTGREFSELISTPPEDDIIKAVRNKCNQYGFKIFEITLTDLGRGKSLHIMLNGAAFHDE